MRTSILVLAAVIGITGCEPEEQLLPFEVTGERTRTLSSEGGTISTPAGAAVHFPAGSLPGTVQVSLSTTTPPAELSSSGTRASEGFLVEPENVPLGSPASLELRFSSSADPSRAWLATVVSVSNGLVQPYGKTRVEMESGIVEAEINELGTFGVVIPSASLVYPVNRRSTGAAFSLAPLWSHGATHSISAFCGGSATPCSGVSATASANLLDLVESAALLYPAVAGTIEIDGANASGSMVATGTVRVLMESGATAESVGVEALLETTATTTVTETPSQVVLSNVRLTIGGGGEGVEESSTVVITKAGASGVISVARSFPIETPDGTETASVSLEVPVELNF